MMEANDLWEITILHETPPRSGSLHDEGTFWCRERKAKAFLLETLTDELVVCVGTKRCAYEVLEYIEQTYAAKNWGNLVTLRETFISSKYEDGQEMTAHLNKLKTVADKLAHQGETVDDKERSAPCHGRPWNGNGMAEYSRRSHGQPNTVTERDTAVPAVSKDEVYMLVEALAAARRNRSSSRRPHRHRAVPYPQWTDNNQACFYCGKKDHQKLVCRLRLRHQQERGAPEEPSTPNEHVAIATTPTITASNTGERTKQLPSILDDEAWGLTATEVLALNAGRFSRGLTQLLVVKFVL
ncbi:hypothetical protein PC120_g21160 [Phytophthora cactorum]|nr:hypothetical protein PC120_g21160 [Phytophthora cactorum]